MMATELNIEQERREFAEAKQDEDQRLEGYTDQYIFANFPWEFKGWIAAKRAAMGSMEPVCWLRTRKSNGEVEIDFDGPIKHVALFDWEPLFRHDLPSTDPKDAITHCSTKYLSEVQRDAERYRGWRDCILTHSGIFPFASAINNALPDSDETPTEEQWDAAIDAAIAVKEPTK